MNETVLVEFLINDDQYVSVVEFLRKEYDFDLIGMEDAMISLGQWGVRIRGKMDSKAVSFVKLKHKDIADCMFVSYISDDLKDKYRS